MRSLEKTKGPGQVCYESFIKEFPCVRMRTAEWISDDEAWSKLPLDVRLKWLSIADAARQVCYEVQNHNRNQRHRG